MKNDPADVELRAKFAALRSRDESLATPFAATLSRARARAAREWPTPTWRPLVAGAALAAVLLAWFQAEPPQPPAETDLATTPSWRAPSDGLLNHPPMQAPSLAWDSLPTTALGRPSFSRYAEDR